MTSPSPQEQLRRDQVEQTLKLWRPVFYDKKVTKEDFPELIDDMVALLTQVEREAVERFACGLLGVDDQMISLNRPVGDRLDAFITQCEEKDEKHAKDNPKPPHPNQGEPK